MRAKELLGKWKVVFIYIVFAFILCVLFSVKENFHVDELLTYSLANSESLLNPEQGIKFVPAEQPFLDVLVSDGGLDVSNVWLQQALDTHPPFYYLLVHMVCTLFPGSISIRYAGIINILFQLLSLFFFRKIVALFVSDDTIILGISIFYILCAGILSISTFLRMYVMVMALVTVFTYLLIRHIEKIKISDVVLIGLITVCGALTHYYFILYAFFASLILGVILLSEKRYREAVAYCVGMGLAGVSTYLIFPSMIKHIFTQGRGEESLKNLYNTDFVEQVKTYLGIINLKIWGGLLGLILFVVIAVLLFNLVRMDRDLNGLCSFDKIESQRYIVVLGAVALYVIFVSKSAPFESDRYISPVYGVMISTLICLMYKVLGAIFTKEKNIKRVFVGLIAVILFVDFANCKWDYLYADSKDRLVRAESHGRGTDAVCLYDDSWKVYSCFREISNCDSCTFYRLSSYEDFANTGYEYGNRIAFFLIGLDSDQFINDFLEDNPDYNIELDNLHFTYTRSVYFCKSKNE